jgi:signal transduction histidine kinase
MLNAPMQPTVNLRLLIPLAIGVVFSIVIVIFSELSHRRLTDANIAITRSMEVQAAAGEVLGLAADAETGQRGYLLTGRQEYLDPYVAAVPKIDAKLAELRKLLSDNPEQRERVSRLDNLVGRKLGEIQSTLALHKEKGPQLAQELIKTNVGQKTMDQIRAEVFTIQSAERAALVDHIGRWRSHIDYSRLGLALITAFNLMLLLVVYVLGGRELVRRAREQRDLLDQQRELERQVRIRTAELSELSINLQNVQEQEKSKVARDIHDELGSILVSAKMDVSWAQNRLKAVDPPSAEKLHRALGALDEGVQIKRRIIEDLRPTLLDNLGLGAAIQWHINHVCERADLKCVVSVPEEELELPSNVSIALFRIVQEALTNVLRHARATSAWITLARVPGGVTLQIRDDGAGLSLEAQHSKLAHGILGMRQRVVALGGEFKIEGKPGGGTTIDVFVPLPDATQAPAAA